MKITCVNAVWTIWQVVCYRTHCFYRWIVIFKWFLRAGLKRVSIAVQDGRLYRSGPRLGWCQSDCLLANLSPAPRSRSLAVLADASRPRPSLPRAERTAPLPVPLVPFIHKPTHIQAKRDAFGYYGNKATWIKRYGEKRSLLSRQKKPWLFPDAKKLYTIR